MSKITHQRAQALLQTAADQKLKPAESSALAAHLTECKECSSYANNLSALETSLRRVFHINWDNQRSNLNLQKIINPSPTKLLWNIFFGQMGAMGKATIVAALLLGYFVIANLFGTRFPILSGETATTLPTPNEFASVYSVSPTPSAQFSLTGSTSQACETSIYLVQENDTLASIAVQHGITQETILEHNHLISSTVFTGMELVIPLCNNTPSHTATITENMVTITPINETLFPTQPQ